MVYFFAGFTPACRNQGGRHVSLRPDMASRNRPNFPSGIASGNSTTVAHLQRIIDSGNQSDQTAALK